MIDPIPAGFLNIMGYVDRSQVNGPGVRAVIWLQGCKRACNQCFNPQSWSFAINELVSVDEIYARILAEPENQGVTFSGGEPFWQAHELAQLAANLRSAGLGVMSFTGFTLAELRSPQAPQGAQQLLDQLDILVDGPYVASLAINDPSSLVSSANQQVHVFNPSYHDRLDWASDQMEIHILKDGSRIFTGFRGQNPTGQN